jgi:hypothetical protein
VSGLCSDSSSSYNQTYQTNQNSNERDAAVQRRPRVEEHSFKHNHNGNEAEREKSSGRFGKCECSKSLYYTRECPTIVSDRLPILIKIVPPGRRMASAGVHTKNGRFRFQ